MTKLERLRRECAAFFDTLSVGEQKPLVFGEGQENEPVLMLIGEAPGEQEALQGRPFVGKAGRNLDAFLQVVRLERRDVYITNVVKTRPTKRSAAGRIVNRPPSREERALFLPWLMREIAAVQPHALVTLGNVALNAFIQEPIGIVHGTWQRAVIAPPQGAAFTLPLFALYHPASVIYNASLKEVYQRDLEALASSLRVKSDAESDI